MSQELSKCISKLTSLKGKCYEHVLDELHLEELSFKQLQYIKKLNSDEGVTVSQIAEAFDLSKPTVTEMIKKFVKADIVYKVTCTHDGRVHYIKLTEKGKAIATLETKTVEHLGAVISERLDDADVEQLIKILEKL